MTIYEIHKLQLMEKLNTILQSIKDKFPAQTDRIEQLYENNRDFQSLCADYYSSIKELKKIREKTREGHQSFEDYKDLISELEKELNDFILQEE